jgi:hypothetical protein
MTPQHLTNDKSRKNLLYTTLKASSESIFIKKEEASEREREKEKEEKIIIGEVGNKTKQKSFMKSSKKGNSKFLRRLLSSLVNLEFIFSCGQINGC